MNINGSCFRTLGLVYLWVRASVRETPTNIQNTHTIFPRMWFFNSKRDAIIRHSRRLKIWSFLKYSFPKRLWGGFFFGNVQCSHYFKLGVSIVRVSGDTASWWDHFKNNQIQRSQCFCHSISKSSSDAELWVCCLSLERSYRAILNSTGWAGIFQH